MNDSFKILLKRKTAEQLTNMVTNKDNWTKEQYDLILFEVDNRGLDKFEEPEAWKDGLLDAIDFNNPQNQFERDIATLSKIKEVENSNKGLALAALILVPTCVILCFVGIVFSLISLPIFMFMAVLSFAALVLLILKKHLAALITALLSILIFLMLLLYFFADFTFE